MRPLREDLRRRIIEARQAGAGSVEVSERFQVSRRTVARLFVQFERGGDLRPKQIGGYRRSRLAEHSRTIDRWITRKTDITLTELQERCGRELGIRIGLNALRHQLQRMGPSSKKTTRAAEQDRLDVAAARALWRSEQPLWDPRSLVFIDETGLNTRMARLHGGSRRGERCVGTVPHGHWASSTFIAALRLERIDAPFLIEGSANVEVFDAYVDQVLRPELRPVDRAILDNLCINKTPRVIRRINARGGPSASCRPTAPTSTRSRWPSPN